MSGYSESKMVVIVVATREMVRRGRVGAARRFVRESRIMKHARIPPALTLAGLLL